MVQAVLQGSSRGLWQWGAGETVLTNVTNQKEAQELGWLLSHTSTPWAALTLFSLPHSMSNWVSKLSAPQLLFPGLNSYCCCILTRRISSINRSFLKPLLFAKLLLVLHPNTIFWEQKLMSFTTIYLLKNKHTSLTPVPQHQSSMPWLFHRGSTAFS